MASKTNASFFQSPTLLIMEHILMKILKQNKIIFAFQKKNENHKFMKLGGQTKNNGCTDEI